jgi:hypothetical protein
MQRVVILGSGGAGKSTFAEKLGRTTGLPVVELDKCFWQPVCGPQRKSEARGFSLVVWQLIEVEESHRERPYACSRSGRATNEILRVCA